jgi:hypothetical protein
MVSLQILEVLVLRVVSYVGCFGFANFSFGVACLLVMCWMFMVSLQILVFGACY